MAVIRKLAGIPAPNRFSVETFARNKRLWKDYLVGKEVTVSDAEAAALRGVEVLSSPLKTAKTVSTAGSSRPAPPVPGVSIKKKTQAPTKG